MSLPVRVKDAASLILLRQHKGQAEVLMGRRSGKHKFMPNKYVFPGGRVDPADSRLRVDSQLHPSVEARLHSRARLSQARRKGLALAAIRETFEETGIVVGRKQASPPKTHHDSWQQFFAQGAVPQLEVLELIGRAITPPNNIRRFDTRFFLADVSRHCLVPVQQPSGELGHIHWVSLSAALELDLPTITEQILLLAQVRLHLSLAQRRKQKIPFFYTRQGTHHMEHI